MTRGCNIKITKYSMNHSIKQKGQALKPFNTKVVGVTHQNEDGINRQNILNDCQVGEKLVLVREPNNKYDNNAIKICRSNGEQIGYIGKTLASELAPRLDKGSRVDAEIIQLTEENKRGNDSMKKQKFYNKKWFTWMMLLLFAPVGIVLLWTNKHHTKGVRIALSAVFGLISLVAFANDDEETPTDIKTEIAYEKETIEEPVEEKEPVKEEIETIEEPVKEDPVEEAKPKLTLSQENAIGSAENYLDYTAFSKKGLIEQLEYEGFNKEDATFAVNHIQVDWKEQAVKSAESYLDYTHFSRSGLIEQLEFEGFSNEHAVYAVDTIGL